MKAGSHRFGLLAFRGRTCRFNGSLCVHVDPSSNSLNFCRLKMTKLNLRSWGCRFGEEEQPPSAGTEIQIALAKRAGDWLEKISVVGFIGVAFYLVKYDDISCLDYEFLKVFAYACAIGGLVLSLLFSALAATLSAPPAISDPKTTSQYRPARCRSYPRASRSRAYRRKARP